jgi:hypothetical protein
MMLFSIYLHVNELQIFPLTADRISSNSAPGRKASMLAQRFCSINVLERERREYSAKTVSMMARLASLLAREILSS